MPLFMFCSGLVFKFENPSISIFFNVLKKRFIGLIIPYFCMGVVSFLFRNVFSEYWYLYVLFVFYFILLLLQYGLSKFKLDNGIIGTVILLLLALVFQMLCVRYKSFAVLPFFDLSHFSLFLWFCLGYIFKKHNIARFCNEKTFSVFALILLLLYLFQSNIILSIHILGLGHIYILSKIMFFYFFFILLREKYFLNFLSKIGFYSLEIYLIHFFLLPKIPFMEDILNTFDVNTSVLIQLSITLPLSLLIIALCVLLAKIIPASPFRKALLGK